MPVKRAHPGQPGSAVEPAAFAIKTPDTIIDPAREVRSETSKIRESRNRVAATP